MRNEANKTGRESFLQSVPIYTTGKKKTEGPSPIQNLKPPILFLETHHLISILTPITFLFYCILKKKKNLLWKMQVSPAKKTESPVCDFSREAQASVLW